MSRYAALTRRMEAIDQAGLRRTLLPLEMTSPTTGLLQDRTVAVFCSNDYLGLAQHPDVQAAYTGAGSGAARLISGNRPAHHQLEEHISEWFGRPAVLFSSGYHANIALMATVLKAGDTVASDALNHASIIDGIRLSRATCHILAHGDPSAIASDTRMAVVEGLYSMDGDRLPLRAYAEAADWLAVDEAHAVGVLGPEGRGVAAAQGIEPDFLVGTLGKALGVYGAFVVGPPALQDLLVSQARSFIYTTALPEPVVRASLAALKCATAERRELLRDRVVRLREGLHALGIEARGKDHIVPIVLGKQTMPIASNLLDRGFWVAGIRPPTVPAGAERLRITVSASHSNTQIDGLLEALEAAVQETSHD